MNQIEQNEKIAKPFSKLKYCGDNRNYQTRSATKKLLDIPCFSTNFYGTQSAKYHCIIDWRNFKKQFPAITLLKRTHSTINQSAFTCSKLEKKTLEQGVKYVQG